MVNFVDKFLENFSYNCVATSINNEFWKSIRLWNLCYGFGLYSTLPVRRVLVKMSTRDLWHTSFFFCWKILISKMQLIKNISRASSHSPRSKKTAWAFFEKYEVCNRFLVNIFTKSLLTGGVIIHSFNYAAAYYNCCGHILAK